MPRWGSFWCASTTSPRRINTGRGGPRSGLASLQPWSDRVPDPDAAACLTASCSPQCAPGWTAKFPAKPVGSSQSERQTPTSSVKGECAPRWKPSTCHARPRGVQGRRVCDSSTGGAGNLNAICPNAGGATLPRPTSCCVSVGSLEPWKRSTIEGAAASGPGSDTSLGSAPGVVWSASAPRPMAALTIRRAASITAAGTAPCTWM
mmetsp:Transcript_1358/g.5250  ORF Transcript_1358/g.5250 Transcript_1358/m.5250 type:complete len:205 (+) Transcript_1358:1937-2551(+)